MRKASLGQYTFSLPVKMCTAADAVVAVGDSEFSFTGWKRLSLVAVRDHSAMERCVGNRGVVLIGLSDAEGNGSVF